MENPTRPVDDGGMTGRIGHDRLRGARLPAAAVPTVAAGLALTLTGALGVVVVGSSTARADTVLQRGADATVSLPDGTRRAGVEGERLPDGATVQAGRTGAVLTTRGREVHLVQATDVTIVDGAHQVLRRGSVIVDGRDAPGLRLDTDGATVSTARGGLVRVDDGPLVRVGALAGAGTSLRARGRSAATVPALYQVQVPRAGLPRTASPLVLRDDSLEQSLAQDLIQSDRTLNGLADQLDSPAGAGQVVLASLETAVPGAVAGLGSSRRGEGAVGYLVATAADAGPQRFDEVRALRLAGGSWGVVAAIVGAGVDDVGARLQALLARPGSIPLLAEAPSAGTGAVVDALTGAGVAPSPRPGDTRAPSASAAPSAGPTRSAAPPSPSPSPSAAGVLAPVTGVVDPVVQTVLDLLRPSPSPSAGTGPPAPLVPLPPVVDRLLPLPPRP